MSDTLREQLKDADIMLDIAGYLLTSPVRKAIKDAITELDRLEAEVKKLVPSATTEPVQAAGDTGATWLVYSNEHRAYWRPDRCGYTNDIRQAGRYSYDEAAKICKNGGTARAWSTGDGPYEVMELAPESIPSVQARAETPTNTEAAEKPKPVSLASMVKAEWPDHYDTVAPIYFNDLYRFAMMVDSTLDQERGA